LEDLPGFQGHAEIIKRVSPHKKGSSAFVAGVVVSAMLSLNVRIIPQEVIILRKNQLGLDADGGKGVGERLVFGANAVRVGQVAHRTPIVELPSAKIGEQ
jgi:hypothetical protein